MDRLDLLLWQLDGWWEMFSARIEGLTDDEYRWEPAPWCWNVRPAADGTWMVDWAAGVDPPPFTTIAWRMIHIGLVVGPRAAHHFGGTTPNLEDMDWPGTAVDGTAWVTRGLTEWRSGLGTLGDGDLDEVREGPPGTIDGQHPFGESIAWVNLELIHHGAEVACLRDLYRSRSGD